MLGFGGFFVDVVRLIDGLLSIYIWVIIARALISWFNLNPYNPAVRFLYGATEPILQPVRRKIVRLTWSTGIDFSPLAVILVIMIVQRFLRNMF